MNPPNYMSIDKNVLSKISNDCVQYLNITINKQILSIDKNRKIYSTDTRGWANSIGRIKKYNTELQIWVDKYTGKKNRNLWYGIYCGKNHEGFDKIKKELEVIYGKSISYTGDDTVINSGHHFLTFKENQYGQLILENYQTCCYLGVYEKNILNQENNTIRLLSKRVDAFFYTLLDILPNSKSELENPDYPTIENRKKVGQHIRRERNNHFAEFRKQNDNYICSICNFDFKQSYGLLGRDFAEAHHIVPLSSSNEIRQTRLEDLITVCSNCHRMLHRMEGEKGDIENLKKIVTKRK